MTFAVGSVIIRHHPTVVSPTQAPLQDHPAAFPAPPLEWRSLLPLTHRMHLVFPNPWVV